MPKPKNAPAQKVKIAILGSGNIGTDLLLKVMRSDYLEPSLFIGRNLASAGMLKAHSLGIKISDQSIDAIVQDPDCCEIVFDATSAVDAKRHWEILRELGKVVIDLTPAKVGEMCIPAVNLDACAENSNLNMVTCGGQASIPLAYLIGQTQKDVGYIETVSSIASRSAGPATRINIDEYIDTTEKAMRQFSGCDNVKSILVLNPAQPCINMQTTVFASVEDPDIEKLQVAVNSMVSKIQEYVPGYELVTGPLLENGRIVIMVRVQGAGDYLPQYAGNLDIINCAAIAAAEEYAKGKLSGVRPHGTQQDGPLGLEAPVGLKAEENHVPSVN
jgi:acetaldehyde dehydrogenase (acetylating)